MALVLAGCAKYRIAPELPPTVPPAPETTRPGGGSTVRAGRPGFVIAAAPGSETGDIAAALAERTGFGLVVGRGGAERTAWERRVREAAGGPLALYVEIQADGRPDTARIDVATAGVDREYALRLRTLYELIRDAYLRGHADAPRLAMAVAPADRVLVDTASAGRAGAVRVLYVDLPRAARVEWRALYTEVLGEFLVEAARLRPPR